MEKKFLSDFSDEEIENFSDEKKTEIIFGAFSGEYIDETVCDVGIVLGSNKEDCESRADKAFELYRKGKIKKIVVSGGVKADKDRTESEIMRDFLVSRGVLKEHIFIENEAKNTAENFFYSSAIIQREIVNLLPYKVAVITSSPHILRSVLLAEAILPRYAVVYGFGSDLQGERKDDWFTTEKGRKFVTSEIKLVKVLIDRKVASDIKV